MARMNRNKAIPFTPRAGMRFIANVRRTNRNGQLKGLYIELVEPILNGRVWIARNDNQYKVRVLAAKLHPGAYHDGWSLIKSEDALPEEFGEVVEDERAEEIFGVLKL